MEVTALCMVTKSSGFIHYFPSTPFIGDLITFEAIKYRITERAWEHGRLILTLEIV